MAILKVKLNRGELKLISGNKYYVEAKINPIVVENIRSFIQQYENFGRIFVSLSYETFDRERAMMFTKDLINRIKENDENFMIISLSSNLPQNITLKEGDPESSIIKKACKCLVKMSTNNEVANIKLNGDSMDLDINFRIESGTDITTTLRKMIEISNQLENFVRCMLT